MALAFVGVLVDASRAYVSMWMNWYMAGLLPTCSTYHNFLVLYEMEGPTPFRTYTPKGVTVRNRGQSSTGRPCRGPAFGNTGHAMALEAGFRLVGATTPPAHPLKRLCGPF